jgi:hypothetical protein
MLCYDSFGLRNAPGGCKRHRSEQGRHRLSAGEIAVVLVDGYFLMLGEERAGRDSIKHRIK